MKLPLLILLLTSLLVNRLVAAEPVEKLDFSTCQDDLAIDSFLRQASPLYSAMARMVEFDGGYKIRVVQDVEAGVWNAADRSIQLNPDLAGAHRVSIIAFEMTNAHQDRLHREVDRAVGSGEITTKTEFALRHELVEYDGLRLHREMLIEIENHLGKIPADFFFTSNPKPDSVAKYELPLVIDFLKRMKDTGHTAHYYPWFETQRKKVQNTE